VKHVGSGGTDPGAGVIPYAAGAAVLAAAMGLGRFAYTPLLAIMRHDAGLSVAFAGFLASANLTGYLVGALIATLRVVRMRRRAALCAGAALLVLTTLTMCLPWPWWLPSRFLTGVASGVMFVLVVSMLLDRSSRVASRWGVPVLFSGVGIGIAVPGVLVPAFAHFGGSRGGWFGTGLMAALILAVALPFVRELASPSAVTTPGNGSTLVSPPPDAGRSRAFWPLALAYGLEGAAYVIPATFLVAMVSDIPALARFAASAWIFVGLAAAPAAALWNAVARRVGKGLALTLAMTVQALAFFAPRFAPGLIGVLVGSVGLGLTFIGITFLTTAVARDMRPSDTNVAVGWLTVIYGVGQIVGPLVAVRIYAATSSYEDAVAAAGGMIALGAVVFGVPALRGVARSAHA